MKRLEALRKLLSQGTLSTQDELREKLEKQAFRVTQSTISRDLRKLGAIRAIDPGGQTVYRLPEEQAMPVATSSLRDLVTGIRSNGSIISVRTTPGSASLVARHIDFQLGERILGTIAGDDTIFVAPANTKQARQIIQAIERSLSGGQ
ncbi:MAG: arginine repressor [Oligoflexia bacterium]|nr:arginine repressor [Oligoflexia bacterium]